MRAIAALAVIVYHFHGAIAAGREATWVEPFETLADHGWTGVQIFFVISGFAIARSVRGHRMSWAFFGRFALRRLVRLDPAYWTIIMVSLAIMFAIGSARSERVDFAAVLANLFYLDNVLGMPSIVAIGWTLCLELQFYLVLVALFALAQHLERWTRHARALVFFPIGLLSIGIFSGLVPFTPRGFFINHWSVFFLGVLVEWALGRDAPASWLFAFAGLELASLFVEWNAGVLVGAATALSVYALGVRGKLETVLSGPIIQFLGQISYSLYLVHPIVGNRVLRRVVLAIGPPAGLLSLAIFAGAVLVSIAASTVFYLLIEHPSWQLSKRIDLSRTRSAAAASAQ